MSHSQTGRFSKPTARQIAFQVLRAVHNGAFADVALDRELSSARLEHPDRRLVTELVYGSIRRQRTLDTLIDQLAKKRASQQPPNLRLILHLGLYQLRYLSQIPVSAVVNTTVELAKTNGLSGLAGFVNGLLRQYIRLSQPTATDGTDIGLGTVDPLQLPPDPVSRIGILHSYPDWMVELWLSQLGETETEQLCAWFNQPPHIDLRINPLRTTLEQVEAAMHSAQIAVTRVPPLPQALRLPQGVGAIDSLPGFADGWWSVQDASAQCVSHLLDPQPGEVIIDACAAPGGKTTHIAELMQDQGIIWACDRHASRLKKLQENATRLHLSSIRLLTQDSRDVPWFVNQADRVLLDAPCSGLGTLHRHADARWRQTPDTVRDLAQLQTELLQQAATWVKPRGILVYATCTLHPAENEAVVRTFLAQHPQWQIEPPTGAVNRIVGEGVAAEGWLKLLPHRHNRDGFFMVRLRRCDESNVL
ncbi:MAG: 16S rRNA (cytosine(967)-C(5))-methyltransferase [Synechococcales cyanobacterium M58_A2018_015]|nr:16S rRNA (cytosine(967)-C(5))-methyltransferase [Synechococcales cyanobacterium M58_A2018_015]